MADIKVNTDRMSRDVENITNYVQRISKNYNNLVQRKGELDSMWDGPASEAFKTAFSDDLTALMTMIENLKKVYTYETLAKDRYNSCENQVAGVVAEI